MPSAQVRIFPYLIGRESAFADNLKWMACANKGLGFSLVFLSFIFFLNVCEDVRFFFFVSKSVLAHTHQLKRFPPRGNEVALRGVQRSSRSNPSSCQNIPHHHHPPGSHVPALRMNACWKGNSRAGKHITARLRETHTPPTLPPHHHHPPLRYNLPFAFEASSGTAGRHAGFLVGSEIPNTQLAQPPYSRCLRGESGPPHQASFTSTKCIPQQPFYLKTPFFKKKKINPTSSSSPPLLWWSCMRLAGSGSR